MDLEDQELEQAFLQAPERHLKAVYDRYAGPLFRFLHRFTNSPQISEEILHDVFLELMKGRFKSTEGGNLKAWLFTVAKNRALNHRKKLVREVKEEFSAYAADTNLEENTIQLNLLAHLVKVENILPTDLKETWKLRKMGHDYQEIAKTLSIPVGTVKSRFSRIVDFLRKEFES